MRVRHFMRYDRFEKKQASSPGIELAFRENAPRRLGTRDG
jgi:hypothetical protein